MDKIHKKMIVLYYKNREENNMNAIKMQLSKIAMSYVYRGGKIIEVSWKNQFEAVVNGMALAILIMAVIGIAVCVMQKLRRNALIRKKLVAIIGAAVTLVGVLVLAEIIIVGVDSREDYLPSCYEFTDGKHMIVIEEKSYLLYGGGAIYQIWADGEAILLQEFSTDDGGRNNGDYEIDWYEDFAKITYNVFDLKNSRETIRVEFQ